MNNNKNRAATIATMYGTYLNQSGNNSDTQPSVIFMNNMNNGFSKFGIPFLINRKKINVNTLNGLRRGRVPSQKWQQLLLNKISYVDMLIATGGVKPAESINSKLNNRLLPTGQTTVPQVPIRTVNSLSVPPVNDYSNVDAYCQKYSLAYLSGNGSEMNLIASTVASMYNISNEQAKSLLAERCLCNGYELPTEEPCPPTNTNSPFYTTDRFCESDWCVDGQGNPLPNAHNDCECCDDTGTGSDIPCKYVRAEGVCQKYWSYMNNNDAQAAMQEVNQFALNEGISTPAAYALVLKCCDDSGLGEFSCERVSQDWCTKFHAAFPFGKNSVNMQGSVNPFIVYASGFGYTLTYDQAYDILLRCCGEPRVNDNPCNDPKWINLQWGGTMGQPNYNYSKNNYCDRCGTNSQGANFPVSWNPNGGNWYYDPANGTNYCSCCNQDPVLPEPTKPKQVKVKNITNIATPTRGFEGGFMMGNY